MTIANKYDTHLQMQVPFSNRRTILKSFSWPRYRQT